jgi:hypothetical protein
MKARNAFVVQVKHALNIDHVKPKDEAQYKLCAELWCLLCLDCGSYAAAVQLATAIQTYGLYSCIESADKFAKAFLQSGDVSLLEASVGGPLFHMWKEILHEVSLTGGTRLTESVESAKFADPRAVYYATCQVVLRFPKRFTQHDPDTENSIKKFKTVQNDTARFSSNCSGTRESAWPGMTIRMHLYAVMREILTPYWPREKSRWKLAKMRLQDYVPEFSTGVCFFPELSKMKPHLYLAKDPKWRGPNGNTDHDHFYGQDLVDPYTSKVKALKYGSLCCNTLMMEHNNPWCDITIPWALTPEVVSNRLFSREKEALLKAVPKDYESSRIIAPNTPYLNYVGDWVRQCLLEATSITGNLAHMNPTDQSINREKARAGSFPGVDNPYVTLDLSHASDSISRKFFFDICPHEYHNLIKMGLESCYWLGEVKTKTETTSRKVPAMKDGKPSLDKNGKPIMVTERKTKTYTVTQYTRYEPAMLATTGNKLTPMLQSIFFLAIGYVACDLCGEPRDVYVYNDDLICRQSVAQTYIELLERCGMTVNEKKSFTEGLFRESCGGEYCAGIDVTGMYWPRRALVLEGGKDLDPVDLQGLIEFQHKMYNYPNVRMKLEQVVLEMFPKMTYSPVGTDCSDLWTAMLDDVTSMSSAHYYLSTVKRPYQPKDEILKRYCRVGRQYIDTKCYDSFFRKCTVPWDIDKPETLESISDHSTDNGQCTYVQEWQKANPVILK